MMTVALSGLTALGAETAEVPADAKDSSMPTATCCKTDKGISCDDSQWVDIETITIEAANGDPIAQYAVAYITDNGMNNTPKDPEKAHGMYASALPGLEKAAKDGDPKACRALARMYAEGKGVDKDPAMAEKYMKMCKKHCRKDCDKKKCAPSDAPAAETAPETAPAEQKPAESDAAA